MTSEQEETRQPTPLVLATIHGDGSADFTVAIDGDKHKFSASSHATTAYVSYEETCSWRGVNRVSEPGGDVFKTLAQSDEMTRYLESHDLTEINRTRH